MSGSVEGIKVDDGWSYRSVAEAVPNLVFLSGPDRAIQYANRSCVEFTGLSAEDLAETDWFTFVHSSDLEEAHATWSRSLSREEPCQLRLRLRRVDGAYRWHVIRLVPVRQDGHSTGWIASATDVDDYHRNEEVRQFFSSTMQALTVSLNYNETLRRLTQLVVPAWADICTVDILDEDHKVQRLEIACCNPENEAIVRQARVSEWLASPGSNETIGQYILHGGDVFVPVITDEWLTQVAPPSELEDIKRLGACSAICVPLRGRNRTLGALTFVMAESGRRYTEQELSLARGLAGRAGVIIDNARLYAASRKVADELREANRAKDEFLGMMSHELRTPITTIYGNAQVLHRLMDKLEPEAIASAVEDIKQDSERLHLIIENLLAMARDTDDRPFDFEPVLISRLLERMVELHQRSHPQRQIDVFLEDTGACVTANPTYLELIVRNLLNNAEKYSPRLGVIEIELECVQDEAVVRIKDRGHGIELNEIDSIFQPFFRSESLRDVVPGVGIGLTVCRRLVEAQKGRIWAEARSGGGTEVCFALPLEQ